MHIIQPKITILKGNAGNRIKTLSVEVEITNKWFKWYKKIIFRVRQDSQMAQSGNFRRLLPILGYMYHPNMLQTLGSNDWRERLFSQNSKQGFEPFTNLFPY